MGHYDLRVLVTRALDQAPELAGALKAAGAEPVLLPMIEVQPLGESAALRQALEAARQAEWVVLTSPRAAEIVLPWLAGEGVHPAVAVVGERTAEAVRRLGFARVFPAPGPVQTAEALAGWLETQVTPGQGVVVFRAENGRDVVEQRLRAAGAHVAVAPVYRTVRPAGDAQRLRELFAGEGRVQAVTFASPSAAENLAAALREAGMEMPAEVVKASIGPTTTAALRALGWPPDTEASTTSVQSLAEATVFALRTRFRL